MLTTENVSDFWIINDRSPKIIYSSDIKEIQVEKITATGIIISVIVVGAAIAFILALGSWGGIGDMSGVGQVFSGWK